MKTLKSVLPVILLLAAVAALPLTRGVRLPFAAAAPQRQAAGWPPTLPAACPLDTPGFPDSCATSGDILVAYDPAATCADTDPAWGAATVTTFYVRQAWESYLYPQHVESGPPNLEGETAARRPMAVAAIRNDTDICFRMAWADATQDGTVDDLTKYADAVAIMIPFSGEDILGEEFSGSVCVDSFHMGGFPGLVGNAESVPPIGIPDCVQNIVQWRPDQATVRNMTAVGFSTSHVTSDAGQLPFWHWENYNAIDPLNKYWDVIYKRPLVVSTSPNVAALAAGHSYPIAFATWDGSQLERDGAKFVTEDYNNNLYLCPVANICP